MSTKIRLSLAVVGLLVAAACGGSSGSTTATASPTAELTAAPEGLAGVLAVPVSGNSHVTGKVNYPTNPPAGGPHNGAWQNCGFYTVAVTAERAVHSLEHGAVWITYRSSLDSATKAQLQALAVANAYLLVSPVEDAPTPISVVAWGRLLRLNAYDATAVAQFIATYAQSGPTVPEPGAACKGAVGTPPDRPNQ